MELFLFRQGHVAPQISGCINELLPYLFMVQPNQDGLSPDCGPQTC